MSHIWFRGLAAALIGGAATGVSTMLAGVTVAPELRWRSLLLLAAAAAAVCAVSSVANYLRQSPLPPPPP